MGITTQDIRKSMNEIIVKTRLGNIAGIYQNLARITFGLCLIAPFALSGGMDSRVIDTFLPGFSDVIRNIARRPSRHWMLNYPILRSIYQVIVGSPKQTIPDYVRYLREMTSRSCDSIRAIPVAQAAIASDISNNASNTDDISNTLDDILARAHIQQYGSGIIIHIDRIGLKKLKRIVPKLSSYIVTTVSDTLPTMSATTTQHPVPAGAQSATQPAPSVPTQPAPTVVDPILTLLLQLHQIGERSGNVSWVKAIKDGIQHYQTVCDRLKHVATAQVEQLKAQTKASKLETELETLKTDKKALETELAKLKKDHVTVCNEYKRLCDRFGVLKKAHDALQANTRQQPPMRKPAATTIVAPAAQQQQSQLSSIVSPTPTKQLMPQQASVASVKVLPHDVSVVQVNEILRTDYGFRQADLDEIDYDKKIQFLVQNFGYTIS